MSIIKGLLYCWEKNTQYAPRLISDLSDEQMVKQIAPTNEAPVNHPAWVFSHLNVYLPVIQSLIRGEEFEDPKQHRFGMLSKPESDVAVYPAKQELLKRFLDGHEAVKQLLVGCDDTIFDQPVHLERWAPIMPTVAIALPYVMLNHENQHFGQISAWRRVQGLPSV